MPKPARLLTPAPHGVRSPARILLVQEDDISLDALWEFLEPNFPRADIAGVYTLEAAESCLRASPEAFNLIIAAPRLHRNDAILESDEELGPQTEITELIQGIRQGRYGKHHTATPVLITSRGTRHGLSASKDFPHVHYLTTDMADSQPQISELLERHIPADVSLVRPPRPAVPSLLRNGARKGRG